MLNHLSATTAMRREGWRYHLVDLAHRHEGRAVAASACRLQWRQERLSRREGDALVQCVGTGTTRETTRLSRAAAVGHVAHHALQRAHVRMRDNQHPVGIQKHKRVPCRVAGQVRIVACDRPPVQQTVELRRRQRSTHDGKVPAHEDDVIESSG
eukprot:4408450-Prymnesium_polylepis.2